MSSATRDYKSETEYGRLFEQFPTHLTSVQERQGTPRKLQRTRGSTVDPRWSCPSSRLEEAHLKKKSARRPPQPSCSQRPPRRPRSSTSGQHEGSWTGSAVRSHNVPPEGCLVDATLATRPGFSMSRGGGQRGARVEHEGCVRVRLGIAFRFPGPRQMLMQNLCPPRKC